MLLPSGNPIKCHQEVLSSQPMIHLNVLPLFSLNWGMLRSSRCVLSVQRRGDASVDHVQDSKPHKLRVSNIYRYVIQIQRSIVLATNPSGLPLPGWAEIRQWAYNTQRPLCKHGGTSPSLVLTGILSLIDRSYRDREIGLPPVGSTLAAAWG